MMKGVYLFFFWVNTILAVLAFFRNWNERYAPYFFTMALNPLLIFLLSILFQIKNNFIIFNVTTGTALFILLFRRIGKIKRNALAVVLAIGFIICLLDKSIFLDRVFLLIIFTGICGVILYDAYPVSNPIRINPFLLVLLLFQFNVLLKHLWVVIGAPYALDYFYLSSWIEPFFLLFMVIFKESSFPTTIRQDETEKIAS